MSRFILLLALHLALLSPSWAQLSAPSIISVQTVTNSAVLADLSSDITGKAYHLVGGTNSAGLYTNFSLTLLDDQNRPLLQQSLTNLIGRQKAQVHISTYPTLILKSIDATGTNQIFTHLTVVKDAITLGAEVTLPITSFLYRDQSQYFSFGQVSTNQFYQKYDATLQPLGSFTLSGLGLYVAWIGDNVLTLDYELGNGKTQYFNLYDNQFHLIGSHSLIARGLQVYIPPKGGYMIRAVVNTTVVPNPIRWEKLDKNLTPLLVWDITKNDDFTNFGNFLNFDYILPERIPISRHPTIEWKSTTTNSVTTTRARF